MTSTPRQEVVHSQDLMLPEACVSCDGPLQARITPQGVRAVCLSCHAIEVMGVTRTPDGVQLGHLPRAQA